MIAQHRVSPLRGSIHVGCVAEAADVALMIKDPQHRYSRLLMSWIPMPDMDELLYQGVPTVDRARMDQVLVTTAPAAEPTA